MSLARTLELLVNLLHERGLARQMLARHNITHAQFVLLRHLWWNPGSTLGQVADSLGVSRPAATQAVERLVQRGLVRRSPDTADRRRLRLGLTARGEELVRELSSALEERLAAIVGRMPSDARLALARGVEAFLAAALDEPALLQAVCLHCGAEHDDDCPVNQASLRLTGRPIFEAGGPQQGASEPRQGRPEPQQGGPEPRQGGPELRQGGPQRR
ncbi:MAG TPA: MarR family transcriptional regulator [Limnochordales bacterium]